MNYQLPQIILTIIIIICLNQLLLANKIRMNTSKRKYILYSYRKKNTFEQPIKIGNEIISQTDSPKFLGIQLNENLCFKCDVNGISIKISKGVNWYNI